MTTEQEESLIDLRSALGRATTSGLLDELQAWCGDPASINDVCDAVADFAFDLRTKESRNG